MVKPGTEELRQNVFSSTHMSTMLKTTQATITYPCCSLCGGATKRKVVLGQISLYTNPSESFIVWYKKHEEPKGLLWLRSYCVRKNQGGSVELTSRGCRGKCSYSLDFLAPLIADEWFRSLKQESRKPPRIGDGITCKEVDDYTALDFILTEMTPSLSEVYSDNDDNWYSSTQQPTSTTSRSTSTLKADWTIPSNPLHSLGRTRNPSLPASSPSVEIAHLQTLESSADDPISRWSWPMKAWKNCDYLVFSWLCQYVRGIQVFFQ